TSRAICGRAISCEASAVSSSSRLNTSTAWPFFRACSSSRLYVSDERSIVIVFMATKVASRAASDKRKTLARRGTEGEIRKAEGVRREAKKGETEKREKGETENLSFLEQLNDSLTKAK